jgi:Tfp pilus assembly PilM family ATPase
MKKSELKEMIKAEMMAEVQYDIDDTNADYDFLAEEYEATDMIYR